MHTKKILIKSEDERLVYGAVYDPLDVDSQGEAMTAPEIKKMAHLFLEKGIIKNIDENHNQIPSGCVVVESYFVDWEGHPDGFVKGAWVLVTRIEPDELWEKVKSGELNGYSFQGDGRSVTLDALVDMPIFGKGETEDSVDGILPPHRHSVEVAFDKDGKLIKTETGEALSHTHEISKATATLKSFDHSHRVIFEE